MTLEPAHYRVGRKVGRTIYRQLGDQPADTDPLVGVMDTPELAAAAVASLGDAATTTFTRTEDGRPTCGFGECTQPLVAAAWVHITKDPATSHHGVDNRIAGALLLCAAHWQTAPDRWTESNDRGRCNERNVQ